MDKPETFSTLMFVDECLLDGKRSRAFEAAIRNKVKPGDVVMDAGTGSGILALFAARTGAKRVYAVEVDPAVAMLAKRSFEANPEGKRVLLVYSDLKRLELDEPVDVLIMELLDTGLIGEEQVPALNALRSHGVISEKTKLIPERASCALQLVEYDFAFYGFSMPMIVQARNRGVGSRIKKRLSRTIAYRQVDFRSHVDTRVEEDVRIAVQRPGTCNALLLRTQIRLDKGISLWETSDMNMPVVVPITPLEVSRGDEVRIQIRYDMGKGFESLTVNTKSTASGVQAEEKRVG